MVFEALDTALDVFVFAGFAVALADFVGLAVVFTLVGVVCFVGVAFATVFALVVFGLATLVIFGFGVFFVVLAARRSRLESSSSKS